MIRDENLICPLCGLVLSSLAAYHRHYTKVHEVKAPKAGYQNGCPILDEETNPR